MEEVKRYLSMDESLHITEKSCLYADFKHDLTTEFRGDNTILSKYIIPLSESGYPEYIDLSLNVVISLIKEIAYLSAQCIKFNDYIRELKEES